MAVQRVKRVRWSALFRALFMILFIAYPSVSQKILRTFRCREVEGRYYLAADMRLQCYTREWYGYALYAFIMGVVYVVGLPLSIAIILVVRRHKLFGDNSAETRRVYGFLYEAYGPVAWWWEVEELLRKLFLTALVVLMDPGTPLQVTLAVLFSGWAHVLHAMYKPWRLSAKASENATYMVQHASLFVTSFVFLMGLLFKVEGVSGSSPTYEALSVIMLLLCIAFVAWWCYEMFSQVFAKAYRRVLQRTGSARGTADHQDRERKALGDVASVAATPSTGRTLAHLRDTWGADLLSAPEESSASTRDDDARVTAESRVGAGAASGVRGDVDRAADATRSVTTDVPEHGVVSSESHWASVDVAPSDSAGTAVPPPVDVSLQPARRATSSGAVIVTNPMHIRREHTPTGSVAGPSARLSPGSRGGSDVGSLSMYFQARRDPMAPAPAADTRSRAGRVGALTVRSGAGAHP
jgi:hypothetical protein